MRYEKPKQAVSFFRCLSDLFLSVFFRFAEQLLVEQPRMEYELVSSFLAFVLKELNFLLVLLSRHQKGNYIFVQQTLNDRLLSE